MTSAEIAGMIDVYQKSNQSDRRLLLIKLRGAGGNPALDVFARCAGIDPLVVKDYVSVVLRRYHALRRQKKNGKKIQEPEPPRLPGEHHLDAAEAQEVAEAVAGALAEKRHRRRDNTATRNLTETKSRSRNIKASW